MRRASMASTSALIWLLAAVMKVKTAERQTVRRKMSPLTLKKSLRRNSGTTIKKTTKRPEKREKHFLTEKDCSQKKIKKNES